MAKGKRKPKGYRHRKRTSLKGKTEAQKHAHRLKVRREWYHKRLKPLRKKLYAKVRAYAARKGR